MIQYQDQNTSAAVIPAKGGKNLRQIFSFLFMMMVFLIPIIVFPGILTLAFPLKITVITAFAAVSAIIFLLNILSAGEFEFPKSKIVFALMLIPIAALASSFFSGNMLWSVAGNTFEIGTAGSLVILFALFILSILASSRETMIIRLIWTFLFSMGISALWTLFIFAMQSGLIPTINGLPLVLAGSYVDFAILLTAAVMLSIYMLNFSGAGKKSKIALWILILLSMLIIGAIGFRSIVVILGLLSLVILVYTISVFRSQPGFWVRYSYPVIFVLIFSAILIVSGNSLSGFLSRTLKINSFDVRPNLESTLSVVKNQWENNAVTGSGPNKFAELWALYKPLDINQGPFWNTDFFFGSGFLPTLFATLGVLGLAAIALFFFFFLKNGLKVFFVPAKENTRFLSVFVFLTALFFWLAMIVYTPGITVLSLAFIFSGLFVSLLLLAGVAQNFRINIFSNPKANFISVFVVVVLMVGIVSVQYLVMERIVASVVFNRAIAAFNVSGDTTKALASINRAIGTHSSDLYQRSAAELHLLNIEKITSAIPTSGEMTENQRLELQKSVTGAVESARQAIALNSGNYQNHLTIGRIYESLAQKGIQGATQSARSAYAEAEKLNPSNPFIQLAYARLAAFEGDIESARKYLDESIKLKSNYTDAYFTLAQLEAASNNIPGAMRAVESATLADPTNAGLYFQLGLLKYQTNDNNGAAQAFERALAIVPDYANAQYFLGLAYYKLRKWDSSIKQFEDLLKTNAGNKEVELILSNLKARKDPFTGATPPIDNQPEKRKEPPIEE